jgi:hypothetical protein
MVDIFYKKHKNKFTNDPTVVESGAVVYQSFWIVVPRDRIIP